MACHLATESVWIEKSKYHDAEKNYFEQISKLLKGSLNKNKDENNQERANTAEVERYNAQNLHSAEDSHIGITKTKKNKKIKMNNASTEILNTKSSSDQTIQKNSNVMENNESITEDIKTKKKKNKKKSSTLIGGTSEKINDKAVIQYKDENQQLCDLEKDKDKKTKLNLKNKGPGSNQCTLVSEIAKARQHIKNSLERMDGIAALAASPGSNDVLERLAAVERENMQLRELVQSLNNCCSDSAARLKSLESKFASLNVQSGNAGASAKVSTSKQDDDDDDGVDLFGSDSEGEDAEAAKVREARLAAYAAKKSTKPALIAKSSLVLDVKPWDDETDLKIMETEIRKISCDGLLWGASKFMPVAFGIQKLSISCVVEDDKVSIDWLTEEIEKFEDFVQSVDVAAFNKI